MTYGTCFLVDDYTRMKIKNNENLSILIVAIDYNYRCYAITVYSSKHTSSKNIPNKLLDDFNSIFVT